MTDAKGPIFAAGFEEVTSSGYKLLFLPDVNNDALQREGKAPVYWWLPNEVRLARKNGDSGDFLFSMLHFVGVRKDSTNVGATGTEEVAGGMLGFSTTSAPPASVLKEAEDELLNRFRGKDTAYWGWRTPVAPMFRPATVVSNITSITDLAPTSDGSAPLPQPAGPAPGTPAPTNGAGAPAAPPPNRSARVRASMPPPIVLSRRLPVREFPPTVSVHADRSARDRGLDAWYAKLEGQGPGTVSPFAINAYSGLLGSYPAAMVWESFHGGTSFMTVWQHMQIRVWSPVVELRIHGEWDRIQDHFSAAGHAGGLFWGADVQAEFNNLAMDGTIEVTCQVDKTLPDADKLEAELNKRKDLVFQKFMDQAQKTIFDPAPFNEQPAQADGGFLGLGGGVAFKLRHDQTHLTLDYHETTEYAYLQPYPISGQMEGLYDEIKADADAEKKYFRTLYLGDWDRKVTRIVKPVVNWPDREKQWVGEPVAFLSAQIGYPNTEGVVQWDSTTFQASDPADKTWTTATEMKAAKDVKNAPAGWTPEKTFLKRKIHFTEPPNETEYPFARVQIEKNEVDLDPADLGTLTDDNNIEVRVDNVGALNVGPISLNVALQDSTQVIEVTFRCPGQTWDGHDRAPVKFQWNHDDQDQPRYWFIFTGQPDFVPKYEYQVRVIVKGSIFSKGMEWVGPWEQAGANGSMIVTVPQADDPGVTKRSLNRALNVRTAPPPAMRSGHASTSSTGAPPAMPSRDVPVSTGWARRSAAPAARNGEDAGEVVFSGFVSTRPD